VPPSSLHRRATARTAPAFGFPDNDPGPQTLLTSNTAELNIDRLHWFLSRFQGYVGITTLMGARFTATDQAISPVLREVGKRG